MFKDFKKWLTHWFWIVVMVWLVWWSYAALSSLKVVDTDPLTAAKWNNLVDHSVPSTAVMAFYSSSCPTWWSPADGTNSTPDLRGTFIRWMNWDANSRDVARTLWEYQADDFLSHLHSVNPPATTSWNQSASHYHSVNPPSTTTSSDWVHTHSMFRVNGWWTTNRRAPAVTKMTTPRGVDSAWAHTHTLNIPTFNSANNSSSHTHTTDIAAFDSANTWWTETRPKNVTLLYCVKN